MSPARAGLRRGAKIERWRVWPFPAEWDWPRAISGRPMDSYHRWMEVVVPASLAGLSALALPGGYGAGGLPHGLQLIGVPGADAKSLPWERSGRR